MDKRFPIEPNILQNSYVQELLPRELNATIITGNSINWPVFQLHRFQKQSHSLPLQTSYGVYLKKWNAINVINLNFKFC